MNLYDLGTMGIMFLSRAERGKATWLKLSANTAILQGYCVLYRETHVLLDELAEAVVAGKRRQYVEITGHRATAHHRRFRNAQAAASTAGAV